MRFLKKIFGKQEHQKIKEERHFRVFRSSKSVFLNIANRDIEKSFFWKVSTISVIVFFIFSLMPQFASSRSIIFDFSDNQNLENQEILLAEDGFLIKVEELTELGDRTNIGDSIEYEIRPGETISEIAKKFGISQQTILQNNQISNSNKIKPGQVLKIPPVDGLLYKVKKNDTIEKIAKKFSIDAQKIITQNNLNPELALETNQQIIIPGAKKPKPISVPSTNNHNINSNTVASNSFGRLFFPCQSGSKYTQYFHYGHYAVDIAHANAGPIFAAETGTVIRAQYGWNGGYGNMIIIDHGNGMTTLYAHLANMSVSVGKQVSRGQQIGNMGKTGRVYGRTGIHLHFEVVVNGVKKNPIAFF